MRRVLPRAMTAIPSATCVVRPSPFIAGLTSKAQAYNRSRRHPRSCAIASHLSFAPPTSTVGSALLAADALPPNGAISEAVDQMVVDHAHGLHVRVDHGGSDEAESPPLQIATERVRLGRRRGNLAYGLPSTLSRPAVDESPAIR